MKKVFQGFFRLLMRILGFIRREIFVRPIISYRQRSILKRVQLKRKKNKCINVAFIVQFPEMWNSIKSICDDMLQDNRFKVTIICVPKFLQKTVFQPQIKFHKENDAKIFLEKNGYEAIDAKDKNGAWIKYKKLKSDFVFVQRPYNLHLPKKLRFNILSKTSLICYTPYGYPLSKSALVKTTMNYFFLKYATYYFSFDKTQLNYFNENKFLKSSRGIKISNSARMDLLQKPNKENIHIVRTVLWTPRWYIGDGSNGKSNFLNYKNALLDYFENKPEMKLIIRPHPLMFENFVRVGAMTQNEVDGFISDISKKSNICLDNEPDYHKSFNDSDVLISDFSSLLYEFILTGKPVLYCGETNDFNEIANLISTGFYNVDNCVSLVNQLELLRKHKDVLLDKRFDIIDTQINNNTKVSQEIVNFLLKGRE